MGKVKGTPAIVLIDGVCVLCSRSYRFVTRRDDIHHFRFVTIQSPEGHALTERFGVNPQKPDTFVLITGQRAYFRTDAVLRILCKLPWWRWTAIFRIVPPFIRDAVYNTVARNRYRWFGQLDVCMIPGQSDTGHKR
jgi:predicted DCC family thiol-disulfide oxidoreductase YuxK